VGSCPGVRVYNPTGVLIKQFPSTNNVWCMCIHNNILATGDISVKLWNYETAEIIEEFSTNNSIVSAVYIDDTRVMAGTYSKTVYVWNRTDKKLVLLEGHSQKIRCMSVVNNIAITSE